MLFLQNVRAATERFLIALMWSESLLIHAETLNTCQCGYLSERVQDISVDEPAPRIEQENNEDDRRE